MEGLKIESVKTEEGLRYRILHDDNLPEGVTKLDFSPLSTFQGEKIYEIAPSLGLGQSDIIAQITEFFPNGIQGNYNPQPIRPARHGVGSAVLERIIEDATKMGAKMVYAITSTHGMDALLSKRGFVKMHESSGPHDFYYKLIK